ncbi:outer membrane beta-barrel protein [Methylobacter sp. YRD-M1]|uniref:outer membrane beta-barrel protein n=1 Tax=Methylobacter sp. YRD-M1 TaxID=2911520 RepID=UPI00227A35EF|nr:outer membrane beta-barrel protein [Methylobacter sp. YRD-M1]WAK03275.1 outer membrane beta-barrel protein [Methylobacter sp. YRD-M1]
MVKKYSLTSIGSLLVCYPLAAQAAGIASGAVPDMKMHVFEAPASEPPLTDSRENSIGRNGSMHMVIFTEPPSGGPATTNQGQAISLAANGPAVAENYQEPEHYNDSPEFQFDYYIEGGYRQDDLDWTIAAPSGSPDVLSELQWKDVESAMVETGIDITYADHWHAEGKFAFGQTVDGRNQDSDYGQDNRQGEFSRSNNVADDGATIEVSGALGYHFDIGSKKFAPRLRLTPKIGYAFHTQQFNTTNGFQTIPALGHFGGLDSTYDATFFGPWGGLGSQLFLTDRLSLQGSVEYHWVDYEGTGNWNLREDFQHPKSFKHEAEGEGIVASAGGRYRINPAWTISLSADYQKWKANNKGIDTVFFSDGTVGETRFNGVNWDSYGFNLGMAYRF